MIPPSEWDISEKVLGGTGLTAIVAYVVQQMMTSWRKDATTRAGASATEAQFKALQDSIEAARKEMTQLRAEFAIMDRKIHVQQRTITKMEVLIIKLVALLEDNGVSVPATLQAEIDAITKDVRNPDVRTRASDKGEE